MRFALRALVIVAVVTGLLGAVCLVVAAQYTAHVDPNGFLHEPFAWMASGRILLFMATVSLIAATGIWTFRRLRYR